MSRRPLRRLVAVLAVVFLFLALAAFGSLAIAGLASGVLLFVHLAFGGFYASGEAYNVICNNLCGGVLLGLLFTPLFAISIANFPKSGA